MPRSRAELHPAVAALVARLCREQAITVVLVAHDVNPILPYLDRVVYLGRGGAVSGTPDEVQSDPGVIESYLGTSRYGTVVGSNA